MRISFKVLLLSCFIILLSSCEDTLDTSSNKTKEVSIKQMMVGVYPENEKLFKAALHQLYLNDIEFHSDKDMSEVAKITDAKIDGKSIEEILQISYLSRKNKPIEAPVSIAVAEEKVAPIEIMKTTLQ